MSYEIHFVIRAKISAGIVFFQFGAASEMPLHKGWQNIMEFGCWYSSQLPFQPFQEVQNKGTRIADQLNTVVGA